MRMLARKTSAGTAFCFVVVVVVEEGEEPDLISSFRRLTDEREISRIGLSLERRIGWFAGEGHGDDDDNAVVVSGKAPGILPIPD